MKHGFPTILSSYDPDTDYDALQGLKRPGTPKWNGGIDLWASGLPAQDAMLINPQDSDDVILSNIKEFVRRWKASGNSKLMIIRLDSLHTVKVPTTSHVPFIDDYDSVLREIKKDISDGFIPSLWALPNFRIKLDGVASILFESPDRISIEIFGPGYDPADISKGAMNPPIVIMMKPFAPPLLEFKNNMSNLPIYLDIRDESKELATDPDRLARVRADRIAARISFLARANGRSAADQIAEMKRGGDTGLFDRHANADFQGIIKLFEFAIKYAEFKRLHKLPFRNDTLAMKISGGRWFFDNVWDADRYKAI